MKEVTKEEFYNYVNPKDLEYSTRGDKFPYESVFIDKITHKIVAKKTPAGKCLGFLSDPYKFFICD